MISLSSIDSGNKVEWILTGMNFRNLSFESYLLYNGKIQMD